MDMNTNIDDIVYSSAESIDQQQQFTVQQGDVWSYNHMYPYYPAQQPGFWPVYQPTLQQRLSTSTQSSINSCPRASNASSLSQWQSRSSMSSTKSSWSNVSDQSYGQRTSSLGATLYLDSSLPSSYDIDPIEEPTSPVSFVPKRRSSQHRSPSEKDPFSTCVSRTRRVRRSQREPRYWCTSCEEPFIEKYDWKRHEETYQERQHVFHCDLCSAIYFLEKDFSYHHETRHNCQACQTKGHSETSKRERQSRSGWGCGFCTHFSSNWKERCKHIACHFEKDNMTMENWLHSNVIHSLLHRPAIHTEWVRILQSQPQLGTFGWNHRDTGRVEGYPESKTKPRLQDRLEYFRSGDDAAALAQLAFDQIAFPSCPPRAPRKDYKDHHTATLQGLMENTESWNQFMSTIPEDDLSPTNVYNFDLVREDDGFGQDANLFY